MPPAPLMWEGWSQGEKREAAKLICSMRETNKEIKEKESGEQPQEEDEKKEEKGGGNLWNYPERGSWVYHSVRGWGEGGHQQKKEEAGEGSGVEGRGEGQLQEKGEEKEEGGRRCGKRGEGQLH